MPDHNQNDVESALSSLPGKERLVLCFGNPYVCDDGFGPQVYHSLQQLPLPDDVHLAELGLCGISLLDWFAAQPLVILVDLLQLGGEPGSCRRLTLQDILPIGAPPMSLHTLTLPEVLLLGQHLYPQQMPQQLVLIGTEGICIDQYGTELSPPVAAAVPLATQMVLDELKNTPH